MMSSFELSKYGTFSSELKYNQEKISELKNFLQKTFISNEESDIGRIRNKLLMGTEKNAWEKYFFKEIEFFSPTYLRKTSERKLTEKLICWWILITNRISEKEHKKVIQKLDQGFSQPVVNMVQLDGLKRKTTHQKLNTRTSSTNYKNNLKQNIEAQSNIQNKFFGYTNKIEIKNKNLELLENDIQNKIEDLWNRDYQVKNQNEINKKQSDFIYPEIKNKEYEFSKDNFNKLKFSEISKFFYNSSGNEKRVFPHPNIKNANEQINRSSLHKKIKTIKPIIFLKSKFSKQNQKKEERKEALTQKNENITDSSKKKKKIEIFDSESYLKIPLQKENLDSQVNFIKSDKKYYLAKPSHFQENQTLKIPLISQFIKN